MGRQNIPFRGHRDDGSLGLEPLDKNNTGNEGNFRELLRFRVRAGDKLLVKHLKSTSARATYISKTVQNQLIKCCGEEILSVIFERVHQSGLYSMMFDETTDIAHQSQMSIVLRYAECQSGLVREDFVGFIDPRSPSLQEESGVGVNQEPTLTGKDTGKIVLQFLTENSLDPEHCVGIATDGCSVMVSEVRGAVATVKEGAPHAVRCPCVSHSLNLSLSRSSQVQAVRNTVGVMKEVISFFSASSKRKSCT